MSEVARRKLEEIDNHEGYISRVIKGKKPPWIKEIDGEDVSMAVEQKVSASSQKLRPHPIGSSSLSLLLSFSVPEE